MVKKKIVYVFPKMLDVFIINWSISGGIFKECLKNPNEMYCRQEHQ